MISFKWLKRYMPRNLFSRTLLILFVPVIGIQLVASTLFISRHVEGVTQQMARSVGSELNYAISLLEEAPTRVQRERQLDTVSGLLNLTLFLEESGFEPGTQLGLFDISGQAAYDALRTTLERPLHLDTTSLDKIMLVQVATEVGTLTAFLPSRRMVASNPHLLLTWTIFASAVLATISALFLRNQIRPIKELARVSEAFGKGRSEAFRPRGAEEVRRAGGAFLSMRNRLERQIEQRTSMLSGVSHDLRTPLTRLRLGLSLAEPGPDTDAMIQDVTEMERMLDGFLAFARGEGMEETSAVDPAEIARTMVANLRRDGARITSLIESDTPDEPTVDLRPVAISRALQNLLMNATRYGDRVRLTMRLTRLSLEYIVEDNGPGIDEDQREQALRPFSRLDAARNQNDESGSVGLGLAIAADVARSHGGALRLDRSNDLGGLLAALRIPR